MEFFSEKHYVPITVTSKNIKSYLGNKFSIKIVDELEPNLMYVFFFNKF